MTDDERRTRYHRILDQHDAALQAFREASSAVDRSVTGVEDAQHGLNHAIAGIRQATEAQRRAIDAVIAANREALALLNEDGH